MLTALCPLLVLVAPAAAGSASSSYAEVDPWDVVTDYDDSRGGNRSNLHVIDRTLRQAQRDVNCNVTSLILDIPESNPSVRIKLSGRMIGKTHAQGVVDRYFQESQAPWEKEQEIDEERGDDHLMGFDFEAWNRTYIRPPKGFGDKQTTELWKKMTIPEFDITKIKLKTDKDNSTAIISVVIKQGPVNKIEGYSSKRLFVQIHAPSYKGAVENELARYLSQTLCISRSVIKVQQGAGWNIRKVRIPKKAIQEQVYLRKLVREFKLERVTNKYDA